MYDYSKLNGRMVEKKYTRAKMSKVLDISETALYNKLSGRVDFKQEEIELMSNALEITPDEIGVYFFSH